MWLKLTTKLNYQFLNDRFVCFLPLPFLSYLFFDGLPQKAQVITFKSMEFLSACPVLLHVPEIYCSYSVCECVCLLLCFDILPVTLRLFLNSPDHFKTCWMVLDTG